MNKRMILVGLFLIGVFCAIASACSCPPCPLCHMQIGYWPYHCNCMWVCSSGQTCCNGSCCGGNCQSCSGGSCKVCDNDPNKFCCTETNECCDRTKCEWCTFAGGVWVGCKVCGGDPNLKCCGDKSCMEKCKIVDGEDCDKLSTVANGCAITDCSYMPNARVYKGGVEKICDPRGCLGDCSDDTKLCYTDYPYVKSTVPCAFENCSSWTIPPPGMPPQPCYPFCCISLFPIPGLCYPCIFDNDNKEEHFVENDTCN